MKEEMSTIAIQSLIYKKTKGFVSLYFLLVLAIVSINCCYVVESISRYYKYRRNLLAFRKMNNAEVVAINRIKGEFREYIEEDFTIYYQGVQISVEYDNTKANLIIAYDGLFRERYMVYDEATDTFEKYY